MAKNKNKAFTIIELLVAMGLLVMLVGLSSVVFSTTVKAHRKATATIEIMRNLRVITEQLNTDFQGLRKDAPLMLRFESQLSGSTEERFDVTHFFADGNFQTTGQYDYDSDGDMVSDGQKTIEGNLARIYYGHANSTDPNAFMTYHVLSRKSHILTADSDIISMYDEMPRITNAVMYTPFDTSFGIDTYTGNTYPDENTLEFNTITLTNWVNALDHLDSLNPDNADHFIDECMDNNSRPFIDLADFETLHLLMAQGVMDFSIQWAYTPDDLDGTVVGFTAGVRWWPSIDPAGNASVPSDFTTMGQTAFGVYFELPNGTSNTDWFPVDQCRTSNVNFSSTFYPTALKFTFRFKDSNNMFSDGKTFSHIVYIDN